MRVVYTIWGRNDGEDLEVSTEREQSAVPSEGDTIVLMGCEDPVFDETIVDESLEIVVRDVEWTIKGPGKNVNWTEKDKDAHVHVFAEKVGASEEIGEEGYYEVALVYDGGEDNRTWEKEYIRASSESEAKEKAVVLGNERQDPGPEGKGLAFVHISSGPFANRPHNPVIDNATG